MFLTCFKQFVINRFYDVIDFCHNCSLSTTPTPDDSGLKKKVWNCNICFDIYSENSKMKTKA